MITHLNNHFLYCSLKFLANYCSLVHFLSLFLSFSVSLSLSGPLSCTLSVCFSTFAIRMQAQSHLEKSKSTGISRDSENTLMHKCSFTTSIHELISPIQKRQRYPVLESLSLLFFVFSIKELT